MMNKILLTFYFCIIVAALVTYRLYISDLNKSLGVGYNVLEAVSAGDPFLEKYYSETPLILKEGKQTQYISDFTRVKNQVNSVVAYADIFFGNMNFFFRKKQTGELIFTIYHKSFYRCSMKIKKYQQRHVITELLLKKDTALLNSCIHSGLQNASNPGTPGKFPVSGG